MTRKIRFSGFFIRLLSSFIILTSLTLVTSSILIYNNYKSETIKENSIMSEKMLSQTMLSTQFMWNWAKSYPFEFYRNSEIFKGIYANSLDLNDEYSIQKVMSDAVVSSPFIYSIYIYNKSMERFYSSKGESFSTGEFFDQGITAVLKDKMELKDYHFIPRVMRYDLNGREIRENVLSLIVTEPLSIENDTVYGALIINLKFSVIEDMLKSVNQIDNDYFIITDKNGRVISHPKPMMFREDISKENYVKQVLEAKDNAGYFTATIEGKLCLVTYTNSEDLKWSFIRLIYYNQIFSKIYSMRNLLILLCVLLFVTIAFFSAFISWKLYAPIGGLFKKVCNNNERGISLDTKKISEFEYISQAYSRAYENAGDLQQRLRNNRVFLRNELLKNLLLGELPYSYDTESQLKEQGINFGTDNLRVLVFKIDSYWEDFAKKNNEESRNLTRFAIANIVQEIIFEAFPNEAIDMGGDSIAVILCMQENDELGYDCLAGYVKKAQEVVEQYLDISLSGAMGKPIKSISKLAASYREVYEISDYRLIYGKKSIVMPELVIQNMNIDYDYSTEMENKILESIRIRNYEQLEDHVEKFFEKLKHLSYNDIMMSLSRVLHASIKVLNAIQGRLDGRYNFKVLQEILMVKDTLEEINVWFLQFYKEAMEKTNNPSENIRNSHVEKVMEIIKQEYSNPNLSSEELATRQSLTSSYLREIFKEIQGISLPDYINQIRCEKAKSLLTETELTAFEISERIGLANQNYFFTLFKKYSGFTPLQYRKGSREIHGNKNT